MNVQTEMETQLEPGMTTEETQLDTEVVAPLVSDVDQAKAKRNLQLSDARASGAAKKRKLDQTVNDLNDKIDRLTESLKPAPLATPPLSPPPSDGPIPLSKRVKITADHEPALPSVYEESSVSTGWGQTILRNSGLLLLGGASFWLKNVYGKQEPPTPLARPAPVQTRPIATTTKPAVLPAKPRATVGRSGFVL
jgi:hypothetical protein